MVWPSYIRTVLIPAHVLAFLGIGYVFYSGTSWNFYFLFLGWFAISGFGIAIGWHRLLAHRAFPTNVWVKRALALLGCFGGQGTPLFWAAAHRCSHHPFSDGPKDVHSPDAGWWHAYMGWEFDGQHVAERVRLSSVRDLAKDPFLLFLHKNYSRVLWGTIFAVALFHWELALFGFILPMVWSMHQESLINLVCHIPGAGYRNFATADKSVNILWLGWLTWGQAFHNNHHEYPNRYDFGFKWYEFDLCKVFVPLLRSTHEALSDRPIEVHDQIIHPRLQRGGIEIPNQTFIGAKQK